MIVNRKEIEVYRGFVLFGFGLGIEIIGNVGHEERRGLDFWRRDGKGVCVCVCEFSLSSFC